MCWIEFVADISQRQIKDARIMAHEFFGKLWKEGYHSSRSESYSWLASILNMEPENCHIKQFNQHECFRVICETKRFIRNYKN